MGYTDPSFCIEMAHHVFSQTGICMLICNGSIKAPNPNLKLKDLSPVTRITAFLPTRLAVACLSVAAAAISLSACSDETEKNTTSTSSSASRSGTAVANVDGISIMEADLELAEAEIGGNLGTLDAATKRRVLVEYLVENQLFANAANKEKLASGPDFDRRLAYWQQRALREAYFEKNVKAKIGESAARALYDDKVKMIKPEEEVEARHILVSKEEDAKDLLAKIRAGEDFATLAKENSGDAGSKEKGGLLGYFGKGQMVPQFEQAAFALQPGEVSEPVKSQFGWHIIKVENRRQKPPPKFEAVKDQILGSLIHKRAQKVAEELRTSAKIEYLDPQIKAMVEADEKRKAATQAALEKQMKEQIEKMKLKQKEKASSEGAADKSDTQTEPAPTP